MISAFLNTCPPFPTIAHYFVEILRYYGYVYQTTQMLIYQGEFIAIKDAKSENYTGPITEDEIEVIDLFYPNTNAAKIVKFGEIRKMLQEAYTEICKNIPIFEICKSSVVK